MLIRSLLPDMRPFADHYYSVDPPGNGGEGGDGGGGNGGEGGSGGTPPKPKEDDPPKTFTQADVDRMISARVSETSRKAAQDLADDLGVTLDEAKAIIKKAKDDADKDLTDAQRAKAEADRAKAEADAAKDAAAKERRDAKIERALIRSHVRDDRLEASIKLLEVGPDASDEEIASAVEKFVTDTPEFFGEGTPGNGGGGNPPPSDPKGKPKPKVTEDGYARGQERAKAVAGRTPGGTYPILGNSN